MLSVSEHPQKATPISTGLHLTFPYARTSFLRTDFCSLNHGSFGSVPRQVHDKQALFLIEQESCPDMWFRESYYQYIDKSRIEVSRLINANVDDAVLIENASSAVNSLFMINDLEQRRQNNTIPQRIWNGNRDNQLAARDLWR